MDMQGNSRPMSTQPDAKRYERVVSVTVAGPCCSTEETGTSFYNNLLRLYGLCGTCGLQGEYTRSSGLNTRSNASLRCGYTLHANEEVDCKSKVCEWKGQLQPIPALSVPSGTRLLDGAEKVRVSLVENGHDAV